MTIFGGQNTIYSNDVEAARGFYEALGLTETFRHPADGKLKHVELKAGDFVLGIASVEAAREDHGLSPLPGAGGIEIVLEVDDTEGYYFRAIELGAKPLSEPKDFLQNLRVAWVSVLDDNPLQFVNTMK